MKLVASLLLLNASALATLAKPPKWVLRDVTLKDLSAGPDILARQDDCSDGQICADVCIPADAMCCDVTVGIYCEAGEQCTTQNTCCPEGSSCGGDDTTTTESCEDDWTQCGAGCIPADADCCSDAMGYFCHSGTTCITATTCDLSGLEEYDDDNDDDDGSSSSSSSSSSSDDSSESDNNDSANADEDEDDAASSLSQNTLLAMILAAGVALF